MNHRNLLNEGLLDDLINLFLPGMRDRAEQDQLKKQAKKLKKYEKDLERAEQKKDAAIDRFEKAWEKRTGKKLDLKNKTLQQILDKY